MDDQTPNAPADEYAAEGTRLLDEDEDYRKQMADFAAAYAQQQAGTQKAAAPADSGVKPFNPWAFVKRAVSGTGDGGIVDTAAHAAAKLAIEGPLAATDLQSPLGGNLTPETDPTTGQPRDLSLMDKAGNMVVKVRRSMVRGAMSAAYNMENSLVGASEGIYKATGLYKVDKSPEEQQAFLDWYRKPTSEWEATTGPSDVIPVMPSKATMEDLLPPKADGVYGFVEGLTQFATGLLASNAALKAWKAAPVVGDALSALDNTRALKGGLSGVAANMTAFDPHDARLSSLVANGPDWFGKPALQYITAPLVPNAGDGEIKARLRAGLEGYLTGQAMEGVLWGLGRLRIKNLFANSALDAKGAQQAAAELGEPPGANPDAAPQANTGPASVVQGNDGFHKVIVEQPEATPTQPTQTPTLPDPHALAATDNNAPRPLDFEHTKVATPADITPHVITVGAGEDGKPVVRGIEESANGAPPKVYETDFNPENIKALKDRNPAAGVHTPINGNGMSDEQWKAWQANAFPNPEGAPSSLADVTGAESPRAKAKAQPGQVVSQSLYAGKAQAQAAQVNLVAKNVASAGDLLVSEEQRNVFRSALSQYEKSQDPRDVANLLEQYGFNSSYIQEPSGAVRALKALVDSMPLASQATRDVPQTFEGIKAAAVKLFPQMADDGVLNHAAQMFGGVDTLPEKLAATRAWMWHQARQISKLTTMVDSDPTNAALVDQQMAALDTLFKLHAYVTGSTTRTAQALASLRMGGVGELVGKVGAAVRAAGSGAAEAESAAGQASSGAAGPASGEAAATGDAASAAAAPKPTPSLPERIAATIQAGGAPHRAPGTYDVAAGMSRQEVQSLGQLVSMAGDNLEGMLKLISGPRQADLMGAKAVPGDMKRNWWKFINAFHAEALLSAASTHLGNIMDNLGVAVKAPLLRVWAGAESGDKALAQEGGDMLSGLVLHWFESAQAATRAFQTGRTMFDASSKAAEVGASSLLPLEASAMQNGSLTGNVATAALTMPSRMLMTADEFFKHLNGRAYTRAQVLKQARLEGVTDSQALAERVQGAMKIAFDPERGAVFPDAIKYARVNTFTDDLPAGLQAIQKAIYGHPSLRLVLPFFRTPANIFLHSWEEAPGLNLLNKGMVDDLNAGGQRSAIARAKADFGATLWGVGGWMALNGKLTGAGPTDPALRKQWLAAGNQPYSMIIGDGDNKTQISYRRGDPFTTGLAAMADIVEMSGELDESSKTSLAAAAMSVFANNVTNKTFMSGLSDFLDAVSNSTPHGAQRFLGGLAGSFVPNLVVKGQTEDVSHEARTIVDNLKNRMALPGFSPDLEPRRNIFGEKVLKAPGWINREFNPFTVRPSPKPSDAQAQLLAIGKAMPMPPEKMGSLDLTDRERYGKDRLVNGEGNQGQSPYDRMQEMIANPPWGGPPLRKVVEKLLSNPEIQKAPDSSATAPGGLKYMLVARPIAAYQEAARSYLLKEYPTLRADMVKQNHADAAALVGGRDSARDVLRKYDDMFVVPKQPAPPDMPVDQ